MWRYGDSEPVLLDTPPAGAGLTYTPSSAGYGDAKQWERIESIAFTLVTSAHVSTRTVRVAYVDAKGNAFAVTAAPFTQTATNTVAYSFFVGGQQFGANNAAAIGGPLPGFEIDSKVSLQVQVTNIDAADAITLPRLYVCRRWTED